MAWMPGVVRKPISRYAEGVRPRMTAHKRVIFHTAVTNSSSLYPMMSNPGTATSHFYVRADGTIEQYASTAVQSSANLEGNHDSITVETWDGYGASWNGGGPGPKWTKAQVRALADIARWAHKTHGVPLRRLKNSRPGSRGIGWHRLGIDGNFPGGILRGRVSGGERWSSSFGKVCPTDTRIKQVPGIIRKARRGSSDAGPRINLTQLQSAYKRPLGKVWTKSGRKTVRKWVKALRRDGYTVKGYAWKIGYFGKHVRRATAKHAKNNHLPYGSRGWPSWKAALDLGLRPYRVKKKRPHKPKRKPFVNRRRVNRALRNPNHKVGKLARRQMNRVARALRKRGWSVKGYPRYTQSLKRAIGNFQANQGWVGDDANGYLGPETCKRLGLRSKWTKLPIW